MEIRSRSASESSGSSADSVVNKFVPKMFQEGQYKDICDTQQALVVLCMEKKAHNLGGNCNETFEQWNRCLAKDCGYIQN
jgi:hypothetical protein